MNRKYNRHAKMRKHKLELKKKYLGHKCDREFGGNLKMLEQYCKDEQPDWYKRVRNHGFEYWQQCYVSGARKYAKNMTNRIIRTKYRNALCMRDIEDIEALHGADYEKIFDYFWTIW